MVLWHGRVDEKMKEQLDRIEEKLDKLTELLQAWNRFANFDYTATYPQAPHELEPEITYYPWQPHATSSSP